MAQNRDDKLDELLGRAIRDPEFRERVVSAPDEVAQEVGLSADELQLFGAALAIGARTTQVQVSGKVNPGQIAYCTAKICNEKGGARLPQIYWDDRAGY